PPPPKQNTNPNPPASPLNKTAAQPGIDGCRVRVRGRRRRIADMRWLCRHHDWAGRSRDGSVRRHLACRSGCRHAPPPEQRSAPSSRGRRRERSACPSGGRLPALVLTRAGLGSCLQPGGSCPVLGAKREQRLAGTRSQTPPDAAIVPASVSVTCENIADQRLRGPECSVVV